MQLYRSSGTINAFRLSVARIHTHDTFPDLDVDKIRRYDGRSLMFLDPCSSPKREISFSEISIIGSYDTITRARIQGDR